MNTVRFEVFTAVAIKNAVFWDVAPCRSWVNRLFGGTYRLHLQGKKSASEEPASAGGCSLHSFLRNVGSHKIYTAPHLRRRHSSMNTAMFWSNLLFNSTKFGKFRIRSLTGYYYGTSRRRNTSKTISDANFVFGLLYPVVRMTLRTFRRYFPLPSQG
jgi:hypothetical protein